MINNKLPLNRTVGIPVMVIVVTDIFYEYNTLSASFLR